MIFFFFAIAIYLFTTSSSFPLSLFLSFSDSDHLSGRNVDFVSRYFSPWNGIDEDPVNGSSHTALVPLWAKKLGKNKLNAEMLSKRGGVLDLEFKPDDDRVMLGGPCSLVIQGKFHLPQ